MSSSITWKVKSNLGQSLDPGIVSAIKVMKTVIDGADSIIKVVEQLIQLASLIVSNPFDIIATFLKEGSNAVIKIILDSMTTGGGVIVITPFNRVNQRLLNLNPTDKKFPIAFPAMSIREGLAEFTASFKNKKDPFRPLWNENTTVVGFGIILSTPDPSGLAAALRSLQLLFNFKEFNDATDKYIKNMKNILADKKIQNNPNDWSLLDTDAILAEAYEVFPYTIQGEGSLADGTAQLIKTPKPTTRVLPSLHWYGLSIANIPFLNKLLQTIEEITSTLFNITQTTSAALVELAKALIRKIEAIKNVIHAVFNLIQSILVSFANTGLYVFRVDSTTGVSGVISAINAGINTNDPSLAPLVAALDYPFSALAFVGVGNGFNIDAWKKLFANMFGMLESQEDIFAQQVAQSALNQLYIKDFSIIPNFKSGKIYNFGSSFSVSIASTKVNESNFPYYFTYSIKDEKGNIISSFNQRDGVPNSQLAMINQSVFPVTLDTRNSKTGTVSYQFDITIFDKTIIHQDITASYSFKVTDTATIPKGVLSTTGTTIGLPTGGKLTTNAETTSVAPTTGGNVTVGGEYTNQNNPTVTVTNGNDSLDISLINNNGQTIIEYSHPPVPPIPSPINVENLPVTLCFDFDGVISYKLRIDTDYIQVTLPGCITLTQAGTYDYTFFLPDTGWTLLDSFILRAEGVNPVC